MENALIPMSDIEKMGTAIATSGLFGMKTPAQAIALMLIAQAENMHPAVAARDYDIIQGRPALKAKAKLGRFQKAGGKFEWIERTDTKCSARFSHPSCPNPIVIEWDEKRAAAAGLLQKEMYKKYPRQMFAARVISEGVDAVYPDAGSNMYVPEEVQDFEPLPKETKAPVVEAQAVVVDSKPIAQTPAPVAPVAPAAPIEPAPAQPPAQSAPQPQVQPVANANILRGIVSEVTPPKDGAKYIYWKCKLESGDEAATYNKTVGEELLKMVGCEIQFEYTTSGRGNKTFQSFKHISGEPLLF